MEKLLGEGAFGQVFLAMDWIGKQVGITFFMLKTLDKYFSDWVRELQEELLMSLST